MLKDPKYFGKIIGFIIAFILFIIANLFLSRIDDKIKTGNSKIAGIEKDQEAYLRNILLGKEDFRQGEFYITLGVMTTDMVHNISGIFNPVATSMVRGLQSLNETLPEENRFRWALQIKALQSNFQSAMSAKDFNKFIQTFNTANELFKNLSGESEKQNKNMVKMKEQLRVEVSGYSSISNFLLTINTIILLIQLFFDKLYELYFEQREEKQKTTTKS